MIGYLGTDDTAEKWKSVRSVRLSETYDTFLMLVMGIASSFL